MYRLIEADHYVNKNILVVGGGDSAVEAAMGLSNQVGQQSDAFVSKRMLHAPEDRKRKAHGRTHSKRKNRATSTPTPLSSRQPLYLVVAGKLQEIPNDSSGFLRAASLHCLPEKARRPGGNA